MHHRPVLTIHGIDRPQLGRIRLNEKDARRQGRADRVARMVLQLAMMSRVRHDRLRDAIFAHPKPAESLTNLFSTLES
jgi:hypothetical protein